MTHISCVWQPPLRSEAPLLLEIFYNIFEGVDAKALLDAKAPQDDEGNGQAKTILAREKAALKTTGTKSVRTEQQENYENCWGRRGGTREERGKDRCTPVVIKA
jgi:hypothetical protein